MKVLIALVALVAVLVVADRVVEIVTARELASRIQSAQHLNTRPNVSIGGWPFFTQVLRGRYSDVTISASEPIGKNGVSVNDVHVALHGIQLSTSDALHGTVANLPVDSGSGTALLTYAELDVIVAKYLPDVGSQLKVVGTAPGHARVEGPFGLSLDVTAKVVGGKLTITPDAAQLSALPSLLRIPIQQALAHPITLPPFPFHVRLVSAVLQPDGVHLRATARNSVFPVR